MHSLIVNEAYAGQRVTGQQRFAVEIAKVLLAEDGVSPATPPSRVAASSLASWLWSLAVLPFSARRGVLLSMTSRAPVYHRAHAVVVHDLFVITNPEWYSRKYVITHAPLLRAHLRTAKVIVTVSEPVAAQVRALGLSTAPVVVAPNAPSPVFQAPQSRAGAEQVLSRFGLTDRGFLLAVGSMDPRKNLPGLTRAYLALPEEVRREVPLVLVGAESSVFKSTDLAEAPGIVYTGYLSDAELAGLYASCRGVVFPSFAEGFGLPLVEAMVAGAQLAVSDIEVFRWICGDNASYFTPTDSTSMTAALDRLIRAEPKTETAVIKTVRTISTRFDWRTSAHTILTACRRIGAI